MCEAFASLFGPGGIRVVESGAAVREVSTRLYFEAFDRRLSMTDRGVIAHARALDAAVVTADRHGEGLIPLLDW